MAEVLGTFLSQRLAEVAAVAESLSDPRLRDDLGRVAVVLADAVRERRTVFFLGNGGSAADSAHLAAEFVGRCTREREPLAAVSLADPAAVVTAIGNDYGFDQVFARQIRALGRPGDVVIALSTSGRSPNVVAALRVARQLSMTTVAMTGGDGGELGPLCDLMLAAPSTATPRIQECHQVWGHLLVEWVDQVLS